MGEFVRVLAMVKDHGDAVVGGFVLVFEEFLYV